MKTFITEITALSGRKYAGAQIKARTFKEAEEIAGPDLKVLGHI